MRYFLSITLTLFLCGAQAHTHAQTSALPKVFLIGEYEDRYLELSLQHPSLFMSVYQNDIDRAYNGWASCLMDMEDYAATLDFDLKGIKLWLNLYFNPDGTIAHLSWFPKPNSRNVPDEHLTAFFKNFVNQYRLPVTAEKGFQHSTSASFPTFFQRQGLDLAKKN